MSWLFGKKKQQRDSPADFAEEGQSGDQSEGFVVVNKKSDPAPAHGTRDAAVYPTGNLYPYVPSIPEYSNTLPQDSSKDQSQGDGTYYLNGVPFKLCRHLENSLTNDLEIDRLRISEILSFVERVQSQNYDYSFSVEQGVIAEMNSESNG